MKNKKNIEFMLEYNPFKTDYDLQFFISGVIWNEFKSIIENFSYKNNKISFIFKKRFDDSSDFNKEVFRFECGKRNVRITIVI